MLRPADLARANGGVTVTACDTGSYPTQNPSDTCPHTDGGGTVPATK